MRQLRFSPTLVCYCMPGSLPQTAHKVGDHVSDTAEVAGPLLDVRDVLETFRRHQILTEDWATVLSSAARALDQASADALAPQPVAHLAAQLRVLLANGLQASTETVDKVADETHRILSRTRIRGIPRPEDEHWEFA
jgi:hypothetical protein